MSEEFNAFYRGFNARLNGEQGLLKERSHSEKLAFLSGYAQGGHVNDPDPNLSRPRGAVLVLHR